MLVWGALLNLGSVLGKKPRQQSTPSQHTTLA